MKFTIDRIEGELLVLLTSDMERININRKLCPDAKEGDILSIEILDDETEKEKIRLKDKLNRLINKASDKDIT